MKGHNGKYKIISNRLFNKLWSMAAKMSGKNQYIQTFTSAMSENHVDFNKKCGIKYEEAVLMLSEIYEKSHLSFKEILQMTGVRKADIANTFCIPIRTVEEWYNGNNPCAGYIKLMILRHYKLINLGKYVHLEAEVEYQNNVNPVYRKKEYTIAEKETEDVIENDADDDNLQEIDYFLAELQKKRAAQVIETNKNPAEGILSKTSFIDDILKRKNNFLQ